MAKFRNYSILLFYIQCAIIVCSTTNLTDSPEEALNFIDRVKKNLNLTHNPNIILVIGNTGCGKSTLVHYVAGDYSKIFAVEPSNENSVDLEIRDELDPDRDRVTLPTESRTLVPVVSTDETHTVWVDTPGFGDTRNETSEIATMFLIRLVIENASNIKIVLVVNHDSVTKTSNRDDFDNLLSRATELMKNIERFENSVSLVVTKTPLFKIKKGRIVEVSEESIKNTTAKFMIDHSSVLEKKDASEKKVQLIDALLKGSISLPPTNEYFPRISIFWRPSDTGPFNKIDKMIAGRRYIRESIFNLSSYSKVQIDDFGFPLTPLAQLKVRNMVQHTVDSIPTRLQYIVNRLMDEIQQQIQSADTVKSRLEIINVGTNCIKTKRNNRKITLGVLSDQLTQLMRIRNGPTADTTELDRIIRSEKNAFVLMSLVEGGRNSTDMNAIHGSLNLDYYSFLEQIIHFLAKEDEIQNGILQKAQETIRLISTTFMHFDKQLLHALCKKIESIDGLQNRLKVLKSGELIIQSTGKEITLKQRVEQLKNLTYAYEIASINMNALNSISRYENILNELNSVAGAEQQLPIRDLIAASSSAIDYRLSTYDWYLFLKETYQYFGEYDRQSSDAVKPTINEANFDTITKRIRGSADYKSTPIKIIEMNQIINLAMQPSTYECGGQTLTIEGHFIKSSNIRDALTAKCSSFDDLTTVKVFVLDTFYVDCDLYLNNTKEVELRIMAPKWDVRKNSTFYLNGIDGGNYSKRAKEGSAGMHREPGTNGGNFFAWANVISNNTIDVIMNGGRGGDGQDGNGSPDYYVTLDEHFFSVPHSDLERYLHEKGYKPQLINSTCRRKNFFRACRKVYDEFILFPDRCCGPTGSGGKGGNGGGGGNVDFITSSVNGRNRWMGAAGENGDTGKNGRYCDTLQLWVGIETIEDTGFFSTKFTNEIISGENHPYNCNTKRGLSFYSRPPTPRPYRLHKPMNAVQYLLEYKSFLLDKMNDPALNTARETFDIISSDLAISSEYNTKDFAMEANILEKHFFELNDNVDVMPLYNDLLKRVEHFSVKNEANLTKIDKKLLTAIYSMILSKITSMRNSQESYLIINIRNFLDLTAENVKEFSDKSKELERIDVINKQHDEYNKTISAKIREATDFIKSEINPEIVKIMSMLNIELIEAVEETNKLQSRNRHEIDLKEEKLRTMKMNVIARAALDVIKSFSNLAGKLCEKIYEKVSAAVVGGAADYFNNNLVDPEINEQELPQSIRRLMHENNQQMCSDEDQEEKLACAISKDRETFEALKRFEDKIYSELMPMVDGMRNYLMVVDKNLVNKSSVALDVTNWKAVATIRQVQKKLIDELAEFEVGSAINECMIRINEAFKLLIDVFDHIQNYQENSNLVSYLTKLHTANQQHLDTYDAESKKISDENYQENNDDADSKEISDVNYRENIDDADSKERSDVNYRENIDDADSKERSDVNYRENIDDADSKERSDVNYRENIDDADSKERSDVNYQENIDDADSKERSDVNYQENIDDADPTEEFVECNQEDYYDVDYSNRQHLGTFHEEIKKILGENYQENYAGTKKILDELEMNLQANLVRGQYFRALGAFKQAVFPYAADYLKEYELPSSLSIDNSTGLITHVSKQIKSLSKKLEENNGTVINERDVVIHSAFFDRDSGSRGPFYVWSNSEIRDRIEQLFDGKKIYLLADVRKSDARNAVKFNKIELEFNSDNQPANNQLREILQSFQVSLTHMGNSNYRCKNKFYTIPSRPLNIQYSIAERDQRPADRNFVHRKLEAGSTLLSPYTMWSMQLSHGQFKQLKPYVDLISIELHGLGLYVEENATVCETNLEKYYSAMDNNF